jgi:hypothetical protein
MAASTVDEPGPSDRNPTTTYKTASCLAATRMRPSCGTRTELVMGGVSAHQHLYQMSLILGAGLLIMRLTPGSGWPLEGKS